MLPVFIWQTPPAWLMPSEVQEWMTVMSSTWRATFSNQSDTHRPLWPCCFQARLDSMSGASLSPMARTGGLKLGGSFWPCILLRSGLGSKVSRWLGPPSMKQKMTLLALPRRLGILVIAALIGAGAALSPASFIMAVSATAPKPAPARPRNSRREVGMSYRWQGMAVRGRL